MARKNSGAAGTERDALQERLWFLLKERSLSDVARAASTPVASVHRYLHGGKVPAEFCTQLVRSLGVNPSWLIAGEGTPYVSDVASDTGQMAGNLLELVEAMSAVTRMKLGALSGEQNARRLRELNDALQSHERLRGKLNGQSVPVFRRLLEEGRQALTRRDMPRASVLHKALSQVARLCDDVSIARDLLTFEAQFEFHKGNYAGSVAMQRQLLAGVLAMESVVNDGNCESIMRLVLSLGRLSRLHEALAICKAALVLAGPAGVKMKHYPELAFWYGSLLAKTGWPLKGIPIMQRWALRLEKRRFANAQSDIMLWKVLAGQLTPEQGFTYYRTTAETAFYLEDISCWFESPRLLRATLKYFARKQVSDHPMISAFTRLSARARLLLKVLEHPARFTPIELDELSDKLSDEGLDGIWKLIMRTHLLGAAGRRDEALRALEQSDKALQAAPADTMLSILEEATHHRNVLRLAPHDRPHRSMRGRSQQWFNRMSRRGFAIFEPLSNPAQLPQASRIRL